MTADRDIPPENGKRPPFKTSEPAVGSVGSGDGYSGQEYDGEGQEAWRARAAERDVPPEAAGSGIGAGGGEPGEDFDSDAAGGSGGIPHADAAPDAERQESDRRPGRPVARDD